MSRKNSFYFLILLARFIISTILDSFYILGVRVGSQALILLFVYLQVKIIKCLVENIVVDISFNQLGGLCTLCFLEEVNGASKNRNLVKCNFAVTNCLVCFCRSIIS